MKAIIFNFIIFFLLLFSNNLKSQEHEALFITDHYLDSVFINYKYYEKIIPGWNIFFTTFDNIPKYNKNNNLTIIFGPYNYIYKNKKIYNKLNSLIINIQKKTDNIILITIPYPLYTSKKYSPELFQNLYFYNSDILQYNSIGNVIVIDINAYLTFLHLNNDVINYYENDGFYLNRKGIESIFKLIQNELHKE